MVTESSKRERASFGLDAPTVPAGFAAAGIGLAGLSAGLAQWTHLWWPTVIAAGYAAGCLITTAVYLHTSLRGKFIVWNELLDELNLAGDEDVLDMGCGRGAVLLTAAGRLPHGRAIGVDKWRTVDQSGNAAEATWANARAMGLTERVELHTADITELPLPDASVDAVVSSVVLHNIGDPDDRRRAVREAARVVRPGGRVLIADFQHAADYEQTLRDAGMQATQQRRLGWRFWYGNPWAATHLVLATRPIETAG